MQDFVLGLIEVEVVTSSCPTFWPTPVKFLGFIYDIFTHPALTFNHFYVEWRSSGDPSMHRAV